jgi:DNA invertase Pin-like site-specific DNA recombinase
VQTQRDNAHRYVEAQGWQLVAEWEDDNRSGADLTRPGFCAMLAAAERGEFDVLVACDRTRIVRHQTEGVRILERLTDAGVLVVGYDGTRIAWPGMEPEEMFVGQATDFASAMLLKGAKRRAREGLAAAVAEGNHTGGPGALRLPARD